jgi:outer membrane protein assembly factor BamB
MYISSHCKLTIFSFLLIFVVGISLLGSIRSPTYVAASAATTTAPLTVYVGSDTTEYAYNASDGSLRWSYITPGVVDTTAVVANGVVYFGSDDAAQATSAGILYALNTSDGSVHWQFTFPILSLLSSPTIANGVVNIAADKTIYAFNASNGSMLWSFLTNGSTDFFLAPSVVNNVVYMGTGYAGDDGSMYALNASTGTLIWQYTLPSTSASWVNSSATTVNGVVYFGGEASSGFYLYALNATTGSLLLANPGSIPSPASHKLCQWGALLLSLG